MLTLGEGDTGQLGLGPDVMDRTKPAKVNIPEDVVQISAGGMHTACLTKDGNVQNFVYFLIFLNRCSLRNMFCYVGGEFTL